MHCHKINTYRFDIEPYIRDGIKQLLRKKMKQNLTCFELNAKNKNAFQREHYTNSYKIKNKTCNIA